MPYRIDLTRATSDTFDRLIDLGALDVEPVADGLAAILPDAVDAAQVSRALGIDSPRVSPATGRDGGSVWVLRPRPVVVGRFHIVPDETDSPVPGALRLTDSTAFGTGLHATTMLCLEALDEELSASSPADVLDVGTGTGVLALAALLAGVARATAIDIDVDAVRAATVNAKCNGLSDRLHVVSGGPDQVTGTWPLTLANILTAPLIEMAPVLTRRIDRRGRLVLSGIRSTLAPEVTAAYERLGIRQVHERTLDGWTALTLQASW